MQPTEDLRSRSLRPVALSLVYLAAVLWLRSLPLTAQEWAAVGNTAIALTGLVIIWYTWETRRLAEETKRLAFEAIHQTALQLRPFVILEPTSDGFQVRNVGRGTAFNVHVSDVLVSAEEDIVIKFPGSVPLVLAGEPVKLYPVSFKRGRSVGDFFLAHLGPHATLPLSVSVECQDAELGRHGVRQRVVVRGERNTPSILAIEGYKS